MNRQSILTVKIIAIILSAAISGLLLHTIIRLQADTLCTCVEGCSGDQVDEDCPLCRENPSACRFKASSSDAEREDEASPSDMDSECICKRPCTDNKKNRRCPVCREDISQCEAEGDEASSSEAEEETEASPSDAVPECGCTKLCTETEADSSCPVCSGDFRLCAYRPTISDLLALCDALGAWYDSAAETPAAVDSRGRLLEENQRAYFFEHYEEIGALADQFALAAPEIPAQLNEAPSFQRLKELYDTMHDGYVVRYFSNGGMMKKEPGSRARLASPPDDTPDFLQECEPEVVYQYPTMEDVGISENRAYLFLGWSGSPDGSGEICRPGDSFQDLAAVPGAAVNLYAVREAKPAYSVTLDQAKSPNVKDDGQNFGAEKAYQGTTWAGELVLQGYHLDKDVSKNPVIVKVGSTLQVGAYVAKITSEDEITDDEIPSGKNFIYTADGDMKIRSTVVTGNITIEAKAIANTYKIHFDKNADDAVGEMADEDRTYNTVSLPLTANAFTRPGYSFVGWGRSASSADKAYNNQESVINLSGTHEEIVTLYALWMDNHSYPTSLQNGSFEVPSINLHTKQIPEGTEGFMWKTTDTDHKIEVGNVRDSRTPATYGLSAAADGFQFAELNAENVAALYQYVATIPGDRLNWGLEHKCRRKGGSIESMQVWIGSIKDIEDALAEYKAAGNKVSGVTAELLKKIKQGDTISDIYTDLTTWTHFEGGYTVPEDQAVTMFAFVSVSTLNQSMGNLLDNVYFSKTPPPAKQEVTVSTTQGGGVTVTYGGNPLASLNSANPRYTGKLENGRILKLYTNQSSGYSYNGAFVDGKYTPKQKLGSMSWTVGAGMPKEVMVLYSKLRTLTFSPNGGVYPLSEFTIVPADTVKGTYTIGSPTKPGYTFKEWIVLCPDLTAEQIKNPPVVNAGGVFKYIVEGAPPGQTSMQITRPGLLPLKIPGEQGINLVARYEPQVTVITADLNGGNYSGDPKPLTISMSVLNPGWTLAAPAKEGYDFAGWKYNSTTTAAAANTQMEYTVDGTTPKLTIAGGTAISNPGKITLTAQWATRAANPPTNITITPSTQSMVYGTQGKAVTVSAAAPTAPSPHTLSYQWYKNSSNSTGGGTLIAGATGAVYNIPDKTPVGNNNYFYCVVTATRTATGMSASAVSPAAARVTVTKRPVTLSWSTDDFIYDGTPKTVTAAVTDALTGDSVAATAYTDATQTNAGAYTAIAAALSNSNYELKAAPDDRHPWTIEKKAPVIAARLDTMAFTDPTAEGKNDEISFQYSYDGDGVVTVTSDKPDLVTVSVDTGTKTVTVKLKKVVAGGQVSVQISAAAGPNYKAADAAPVLLNIQQGQLIGGADDYRGVYDGKAHGISVKPMFLGYPHEITYSTDGVNYAVGNPTYIDAGKNQVYYKINIKPIAGLLPAGLEIKGSKSVTITKAPLTAAYVNESITFGGTPALRVDVNGFVNGETAAVLPDFAAPDVVNNNTLPGVYSLTPQAGTGSATANYEFINYNSGSLTILPADMGMQVSSLGYTGVYDGKPHSITVNAPAGAAVKYGPSADACTRNAPTGYTAAGSVTEYYRVIKEGFKDVQGSATVTITKAPLTADYAGESISFNQTPALTVTVTGFVNGETAAGGTMAAGYTAPKAQNSNTLPGSYQLIPSGGAADNYSFRYTPGTLLISPIDMPPGNIPVVTDYTGVYDGEFHSITLTNIPAGAMMLYGTGPENRTQQTLPNFRSAGSETVYYVVMQPGYNNVEGSAKVTIRQRLVEVEKVTADNKIYDGNLTVNNAKILLKAKASDTDTAGVLPSDRVTADGTVTFSTKDAESGKKVNISNLKLEGADKDNYHLAGNTLTDQGTTAEITSKPVKLEWNFSDKPGIGYARTYDGQPSNVYAVVKSGELIAGDTCDVKMDITSPAANGKAKNAGVHTAKAASVSNQNYTLPGSGVTQEYENTPAKLTAKYVDETIVYGKTPSGKVVVTGFVGNDASDNLIGYSAPTVSISANVPVPGAEFEPAGGNATANYEFVYKKGMLTVLKSDALPHMVSNYNGAYDGLPHEMSITADSPATIKYSLDNGSTYNKTPVPTQTDVGTTEVRYQIERDNFTTVTGKGEITITPKKVTPKLVLIDPQKTTKEYDKTTDASTLVKVELDGLVGSETLGVSEGGIHFTDKNVGADKAVTTGILTLQNGTGKATNYELTNNIVSTGGFDITAKPVTLKLWENATDLTYTGKEQNVTVRIAEGLISDDDECKVIVTGGREINAKAAANPYTATAALNNGNYIISGAATKTYSIGKAPLAAAYAGETIRFGETPKYEVKVTGFVNDETEDTAAGYIKPTLSPPSSTNVGTYPLILTDGSADNYELTKYTGGDLIISGADMSAQVAAAGYSGVYDGSAHGITVIVPSDMTVTYYSDGDYAAEHKLVDADAAKRTNAGQYTVYYEVTKPNYAPVRGQAAIDITKKSLKVTVSDIPATREYNGKTETSCNLTLSGIVAADQVTATATVEFSSPDAGMAKPVNVTGIVLSGAGKDNYSTVETLKEVPTNAAVTPKAVKLKWLVPAEQDMVYNGEAKHVTAVVDEDRDEDKLVSGDSCSITVTGGTEMLPGSYTAMAAELSNSNYKLPADDTAQQVYTIAKGRIFITAKPYRGLYDRASHDAVTAKELVKVDMGDGGMEDGMGDGMEDGDTEYFEEKDMEAGDVIRYRIDSINDKPTVNAPWLSTVPRIAARGAKMTVTVQVERLYYELCTAEPAEAWLWNAPTVTLEAPEFYAGVPNKVTLKGKVSNDKKRTEHLDYVYFIYRKEGKPSDWKQILWLVNDKTSPVANPYHAEVTLEDLEPDTMYETWLMAANWEDTVDEEAEEIPFAVALLKFRTLPLSTSRGSLEGTVRGEKSPAGSISVTLCKSDIVVASRKGLSDGSTFSFAALSDGEYNLMASDGQYITTKVVSVKNGRQQEADIQLKLSPRQTEIYVGDDDAPPVMVEGMDHIFNETAVRNNPMVAAALRNDGTVRMTIVFTISDEEDAETAVGWDATAGKKGVQLDALLHMTIIPSSADELEEPFEPITELENPLEIIIELPLEMRNKIDYRIYRSHEGEAPTRLVQLNRRQTKAPFDKEGVYVEDGTVYLYTRKFSTFVLTYKDKKDEEEIPDNGGGRDHDRPTQAAEVPSISVPESIPAQETGASRPADDTDPTAGGDNTGSESREAGGEDKDKDKKEDSESKAASKEASKDASKEASKEAQKTKGDSDSGQENGLGSLKESLKKKLMEKRDEALNSLPAGLTQRQRKFITAAINRIYDEAVGRIDNAGTISEATGAYRDALRGFEAALHNIPSDAELARLPWRERPFVLLNALLAIVSMLLAVLTCLNKRRGMRPALTVIFAGLTLLVFVFTFGINGMILTDQLTIAAALFCTGAAVTAGYREKRE